MSNNLIQIIRKKFTDTLNKIRPQYNQPSFVEFLSKPVEESKEPLKEGSKIFQQFESIIDEKYREFQRTFQVDEKKIFESIVKEPTEYIKNAQLKSDYVEFLVEYSGQNPMLRPGELREKLENSEQRPPHLWMEFQQKHLGKDLIERLEKIRTDPQFQDYIKAKERWKEDMKSRQPPITGDKAIDNHLKYVEILPQVHRWIMRQLYMDFRHHNQANFFKFLEKDFNDQKQLAREKVQKQQMQRQMPQQNNPFEQQQQQPQNKQHPQQQNHYDPMKQQQMSSQHNSAYDPMKQQSQMSSQSNSYDSMKQNPQQQPIHQYDQNKYNNNPYDTNKHMQQQPSGHYDSSKIQGNQGMQNQYSSSQGQGQGQNQGQYSQYNNQQQNNSYQQHNQYDSMNKQQNQYPQQNMYDSNTSKMNPYEQANKQQSMNSYDPSKQYQQQQPQGGHQMNQINTHASPQLSHGHQMNQQNAMQRGGVGPNAAANRGGKMMPVPGSQGQGQGQNQNQGSHNYQQTSSSLPSQHQNMPHNPAQISAGQSPRTLPSPGMHQGQPMMAQQQQMHNSQQSGHMQHMQGGTIQNQPSPHQNANNPYSMNSSYNPHQNPSMTQMQHKQQKMGVGAPSPSQLQNQTMPSNPSTMSHSGMSGHYGQQTSQQGRQMPGQNQNMSQGSNQYNSAMGRDKIDSLNARQSLSQQSQYSNESLTPRQSLSQNQPQNPNMYQQNQVSDQARQQAEAQAQARAQAEAQAQARAQAEAQARAQAEAAQAARAKAEAENQARMRQEAEQQARLRAEAQARAKAEAENQARMRQEAEAARAKAEAENQARMRQEAEQQARLRAEAQAQAQAQAEAQAQAAKEAALKRSQQQQQAQQAALNTQMRPHVIQKETFNLSDDFGNLNFNDFGTGLNEVADKFRHQYGNRKVIEDFERNIRDEIYQRDESIAEIEQQAQAQKKRVKVNPSFEEELNLIPSASTSTSTKESFISPTSTVIPEPKQPILKPVERELNELKMDHRVKVDERGSLSVSPYIDAIFYKMNDGIISYHEKLVLKIFQDESRGIEIQEMANLPDFMSDCYDTVYPALINAQLKVLVETWLEFSEMCAQKANSKIQDLDDLFG